MPLVSHAGLWGTTQWVDREHGYAAVLVADGTQGDTTGLGSAIRPMLEETFPAGHYVEIESFAPNMVNE